MYMEWNLLNKSRYPRMFSLIIFFPRLQRANRSPQWELGASSGRQVARMERDWTVLRVVVNSENTRTVVRGWTALWVVANLGKMVPQMVWVWTAFLVVENSENTVPGMVRGWTALWVVANLGKMVPQMVWVWTAFLVVLVPTMIIFSK